MTSTRCRLFGPLMFGGHVVIVIATLEIQAQRGSGHFWAWASIEPEAVVVIGSSDDRRCFAWPIHCEG
jgi:hypothetical protein